ncbi:TPA: UDP-N-acetylenolpyruvoylglucosamine reductase [Candidatus Dependentiae bacterium]|nr:MAG: UDP-N-acetylenolpyruvoylglucosamine reductase [candidate division TM6 bacterium GW2011_GWF2_36_131]KKQ03502.1 MAG: UDP-N-acetylenolpyruvoylglucosamine reductase [candidate division TM6 bacterium GW2011_GWE2_36_25]KKQ20224.1 MAG: UDP-N-acetylenolpyruvoylglucosamine reductase [candidate division TM6 bacterium GW2011_GWA2_36_9]HBR70763.1 UDP-N-acetylenolpyruvoylglucosamine reductase [Candidatus Dependentiae bacterium]HCU00148.1 UDP-N-acetylenolpyruvoylglucosamine reductase [Candidatus Depe
MNIEKTILLKDKNWFAIGGPAEFFAEPTTGDEFAQAVNYAREKELETTIIGLGANMLISDEGIKGLVIRPQLKKIIHELKGEDVFVTAEAGVTIEEIINYCLDHQLVGLEEFSGIPGTIGGSVFINIHYFQYNLHQFMISGQILEKETGKILDVDRDWFQFGYDQSKLHEKKHYLINATFKLKKVSEIDAAYAKGRSIEIIRHRITRYPYKGTCGCFFRNFHENEVALEINGKKMIYTSYYLDKLGIKGELSVGGARVSHQHANMIVNSGNATAQDVINLARKMQELVQKNYGILPQAECQFLGFKEYPLF